MNTTIWFKTSEDGLPSESDMMEFLTSIQLGVLTLTEKDNTWKCLCPNKRNLSQNDVVNLIRNGLTVDIRRLVIVCFEPAAESEPSLAQRLQKLCEDAEQLAHDLRELERELSSEPRVV